MKLPTQRTDQAGDGEKHGNCQYLSYCVFCLVITTVIAVAAGFYLSRSNTITEQSQQLWFPLGATAEDVIRRYGEPPTRSWNEYAVLHPEIHTQEEIQAFQRRTIAETLEYENATVSINTFGEVIMVQWNQVDD